MSLKDSIGKVFNSGATPSEDVAALQAEIERLTQALSAQEGKTSAAEQERDAANLSAAANQGVILLQGDSREVPTGRTVTVSKSVKYRGDGYRDDGRQVIKPVFEPVDLPTYYYKIDLPASGGWGLKINGVDFAQDQTYEVDEDLLRTIKDMVARAWAHEATIRGSNENVFRKMTNRAFNSGKVVNL